MCDLGVVECGVGEGVGGWYGGVGDDLCVGCEVLVGVVVVECGWNDEYECECGEFGECGDYGVGCWVGCFDVGWCGYGGVFCLGWVCLEGGGL